MLSPIHVLLVTSWLIFLPELHGQRTLPFSERFQSQLRPLLTQILQVTSLNKRKTGLSINDGYSAVNTSIALTKTTEPLQPRISPGMGILSVDR